MSRQLNIGARDSKTLVVQRVLDIEKKTNPTWLHAKMSNIEKENSRLRAELDNAEKKTNPVKINKRLELLEQENSKLKNALEDKKRQLDIILHKYEDLLPNFEEKNKTIKKLESSTAELEKIIQEKQNYIDDCINTLFMCEMILNRKIPMDSNGRSRFGF